MAKVTGTSSVLTKKNPMLSGTPKISLRTYAGLRARVREAILRGKERYLNNRLIEVGLVVCVES